MRAIFFPGKCSHGQIQQVMVKRPWALTWETMVITWYYRNIIIELSGGEGGGGLVLTNSIGLGGNLGYQQCQGYN